MIYQTTIVGCRGRWVQRDSIILFKQGKKMIFNLRIYNLLNPQHKNFLLESPFKFLAPPLCKQLNP